MSLNPEKNTISIASTIATTSVVWALFVVLVLLMRETQHQGYTAVMRGSGATFFFHTNSE